MEKVDKAMYITTILVNNGEGRQSYRFFMIPKEVHNMANRLKIGSAMTKVD